MDTWLKFILLFVAGYIVGSIPLSYLTGRARGVNLKKQGTHQVGAGNLWRTTSRRLGFFVGLYDFLKGMLMVYIAKKAGLDAGPQLMVGVAAIIGHNWPVFLKFHGGRGAATALGLVIIIPAINTAEATSWPVIVCFGVLLAVISVAHRTPVPVLAGLISLPITSAIVHEPLTLRLAYGALLIVMVLKRLTAQPITEKIPISMGKILLNRLLFDRDIRDRAAWVSRKTDADGESRQ